MGVARRHNPGTKPGPRFAYENLEIIMIGSDHLNREQSGATTRMADDRVMPSYVAIACKTAEGTVHRWRKEGLTFWAADKAAVALGYHPNMIWPDWQSKGIDFYGY
jgi:hypothetical protein